MSDRLPPRFIRSWWHGTDIESALECLSTALATHSLVEALPTELLQRLTAAAGIRTEEDEQAVRRHQIGITAVHANLELARRGDDRRLRSFGVELRDEEGEPAWFLVTPTEHATLLAIGGAPSELEAAYDTATDASQLPATLPPTAPAALEELGVARAQQLADAAFKRGNNAEVVRLAPIATQGGHHGLLAQLQTIHALWRLNRRDDARAMWATVAVEWLSNRVTVWDSQWKELVKLHTKLGLPEDEQVIEARARIGKTK